MNKTFYLKLLAFKTICILSLLLFSIACSTEPEVIIEEKIVEISKEVVKEVEVEVEKIVEKEVEVEVVVEKEVPVEVIKEVETEVTVTEEVISPISYVAIGLGVVLVVVAGVIYSRSTSK